MKLRVTLACLDRGVFEFPQLLRHETHDHLEIDVEGEDVDNILFDLLVEHERCVAIKYEVLLDRTSYT